MVSVKSLEKLILDVFLVADHDSDLKNRCSTGRFRVIAIHILSLTGGSNYIFIVDYRVYVGFLGLGCDDHARHTSRSSLHRQ